MEPMRDVRLLVSEELEARTVRPAPRCEVCDAKLPRGRRRTRCFDHSELVQSLIEIVDRRRRPGALRRVA